MHGFRWIVSSGRPSMRGWFCDVIGWTSFFKEGSPPFILKLCLKFTLRLKLLFGFKTGPELLKSTISWFPYFFIDVDTWFLKPTYFSGLRMDG
jgi:hypothetical protein